MRVLTPSQRRAVETVDRDLCVVAGAGSGKTAVLAERFVHLVLAERVPVDRILALTFTDRAAVEMRERVAREFARRGRPDLRREVETARVTTFHAFCARLLKENAVEAGVDPSFAVLTEAEASVLKERARDAVFERRLRDDRASLEPLARLATGRDDLTALLAALLDRGRATGRPFDELLAGESTPPDGAESGAALGEALRNLDADRGEYTAAGNARADAVLAAAAGLEAAGADPDALDAALERVRKAVNLGVKGRAKENLAAVKERADGRRAVLVGVRAAPAARALASFLAEWEREYALRKGLDAGDAAGRGSRPDFVDLERLALALLRDDAAVREEVRGRFEHALVDEYQDTNPVQEALLALLRREGRGFVVGDPKQAIYGFRGADHRGFARAREAAGERGTVPMRENFRGRPELLAVANAVLAPAFAAGGGAQVPWEPLVPGAKFDAKPAPSVELHLVDPAADENAEELRIAEAAVVAERIRALVEGGGAAITARDAEGASLARRLAWGDAAILLRSTTDMKVYERALAERDIPYAVAQGRGFYESREVVDLANLLACVESPRDEVLLASVLRSPFAGLDDDALLALAQERARRGVLLADLLEPGGKRIPGLEGAGRRRWDRFRAAFDGLRERRGRGRLVEVVEAAVAGSGFGDAVLLQRNGRQRAANLRKVREMARVFESDGAGGLGEFVGAVRRFRLREERETEAPLAGEDAVALLSVHQAKGLEWPLVVLPDLGRRPPSGGDPILLEDGEAGIALRVRGATASTPRRKRLEEARKLREAAESIRVLHVAMTRAKEHLVLSSGKPARGGGGPWLAAVLDAVGGIPDAPGAATLPLPGGGASILLSRSVPAPAGRAARAASLLATRRSRFLAGRGPGLRVPAAVRRAAREAVARVDGLAPIEPDGTPYLSTVSALLDFEACPLRWFWRHRVGVPDRGPAIPADAAAPDADLAAGSALARTDAAPPAPAAPEEARRDGRPGDDDEEREPGEKAAPHGVPRRVTGTAVHAVLGNLDFERDDAARVRAAAAARLREELEEEPPAAAVEEVAGWVARFRESPLGREVAAAGREGRLLREVPFLLKDEGVLLRGQIDLAFRDAAGRWTVADYKASRPPRRREGRLRYERQVHYYARALRAAPGVAAGEAIRGALVYLDPSSVVVEVEVGSAARGEAAGILRRFARLAAADAHPPDRSHCRACPYGPDGLASCPEAPRAAAATASRTGS